MRITFVTPSLACGGAERCVTLLTKGLLARRYEVSVITLYGAEHDFFKLPDGAHRLALGIDGDSANLIYGLGNNLRRLRILRNTIESTTPGVVVSHIHRTNVMTILAARRSAIPVIAVEHNDPTMSPIGNVWETLRRQTYLRAQKIVSVSHGVDAYFSWLPSAQRLVIHNPVEPATEVAGASKDGKLWIASMGRLTPQKGFDRLLKAFAQIASANPQWRLKIIGDGPLRSELEELARKLGISSSVVFAGLVAEPVKILQHAKFFVMASRYEGFPYAALEALAVGLPVIYTDCPSGPREIVRHEIDGLLVTNGDNYALASAMERLMTDRVLREAMATHAPQVLYRFGIESIVDDWEALFTEIRSIT